MTIISQFYLRPGTFEYHIDQTVCHELGHIVLGHGCSRQFDDGKECKSELYHKFLPNLDSVTVHAVLGRAD